MGGHLDEDQVLITGLEVDGRPVGIGDKINGQTVLAEGISYTSSITLNNENRDFVLSFNNLSYAEEQQKYNYRLLPYQTHWLVSNDGEKATYMNLPEGDYTFEVKNIYPDGKMERLHHSKYIFYRIGVVHCLSDYLFYCYWPVVWLI